MKKEQVLQPLSGKLALVMVVLLIVGIIVGFSIKNYILGGALIPVALLLLIGLNVISPNNSKVFLLFGEYKGSVKENGLFWMNPLYTRTTLSLKARNFESEKIKVNDKMGNPIF